MCKQIFKKTLSTASKIRLIWVLLLFLPFASAFAQNEIAISQIVEQYNGKSYYLHKVESQQTLYGIAKAYGITVEALMNENSESRSGIRVNQILRIPMSRTTTGQNPPQANAMVSNPNDAEYDYVYHVAGKNENFKYLSDVYLVNESLIRNANPSIRAPFTEGDYVLIPITKKDNRPPVTDSRFKRSGYDPYNQPLPKGSSPKETPQLPPPSKIETVSPFDAPLRGNTSNEQNVQYNETPVSASETATITKKNIHVVKPKETLFSISQKYQISQRQLMESNPGLQEKLKVGQVLKLPEYEVQSIAPSVSGDTLESHIVAKGETLYQISRRYGVGVDNLKRTNTNLSESLKVGQKILIPKKKITEAYLIHKVESQQKTRQLAKDYGLSQRELEAYNPSIGSQVFPNQKVRIPLINTKGSHPVFPDEVKREDKTAHLAENEQADMPNENLTTACTPDPKMLSQRFKVALMLPLQLDKAGLSGATFKPTDENLQTALRFLPFYKGFVLAADSMSRVKGLNIEIKVYDVGQSAAAAEAILNDPSMQQTDLIVGPFFNQPFKIMADFALKHEIMIVNPMSQRREILENNPYVIKVKPDPSTQLEQLASLIANRYPTAKVFIYQSHRFKNVEEVKQLQEILTTKLPAEVRLQNEELSRQLRRNSDLSFNSNVEGKWIDISNLQSNPEGFTTFPNEIKLLSYDNDSLRFFRKNASLARENIVIAYGDDRVFAMEFLNKLNQLSENLPVKLIGLPNWAGFDNLFNESLLRLNTHFFNIGFITYESTTTTNFIQSYRSTYSTEPDQYSFEGFDMAWYFLHFMQQYGSKSLQCLPYYPMKLLNTEYHFVPLETTNGFENTYWDIYKYENYSTIPIANPYFGHERL
ncbi:MAG: LysM peptidoglycan-binding domain-containing protein [Bacteroidales bacterium]|nr:LysM peptidoglycan-binding domain-containing protein [Bacteroidales bacterium]